MPSLARISWRKIVFLTTLYGPVREAEREGPIRAGVDSKYGNFGRYAMLINVISPMKG
jgi:hypothetical protein